VQTTFKYMGQAKPRKIHDVCWTVSPPWHTYS